MMDLITLFIISVIVVMFIMLFTYLRQEVLDISDKAAAKATRRILLRFGFPRGFKVLSNITVKADSSESLIENMLIGYFGILLVHTLGTRGEYYGSLDSENWTLIAKEKKQVLENPVKRLKQEEAALRAVLSKNKVYNIPIERIVYVASKSKKTAVYVTHSGELLLGGKLSGYLDKTKFEKDIGLDVKKIEAIVSGVNTVS